MADVPEQMTWQGGLWIGIFVNRDYCRSTPDRSPVAYRPERMSSLTRSRERRLQRPVGCGTFGIHERHSVEAG